MVGKSGKKVLAAGTFEYLHPGHVAFLKNAARFGRLFVIVSRDENAEKIKKRKLLVPEKLRLAQISSLKIVEEALLGGKDGLIDGIRKICPDIIYLGPDQMSVSKLKGALRGRGFEKIKIRRMGERVGSWKSSKILKKLLE